MTRYASTTSGLTTWSRTWEVQRAPFHHPLPYAFTKRRETQYYGLNPGDQVNDAMYTHTILNGDDHRLIDSNINRARASALNRAKGAAQAALGISILEWRSSLSMITGALQSLARKRARARLYYRRKASDIYLEGVFGWVPLMSDIYQAFEVLGAAHRVAPTVTRSRSGRSYRVDNTSLRIGVTLDVVSVVGVRLSLDNPNVILLNNLGLLNPASIAWDRVPYSFVINWFWPIGQYLNSLTDLLGYGVHDGFVTSYSRKTAAGSYFATEVYPWTWRTRVVEQVYVKRSLGFPSFSMPRPSLPTVDLGKALISLALFDKTRDPAPLRR